MSETPTIVPAALTHSWAGSQRGTLNEDFIAQREISGQPATEGLPGSNFPHASLHNWKDDSRRRSKSIVADELAQLHPPLYVAAGSAFTDASDQPSALGLRQQHLAALTTIMHKCLLEGDYGRASRAWGMLLRTEHSGQSLDLRTNNRWGLGAEFLLQRPARLLQPSGAAEQLINVPATSDSHPTPKTGYSVQRIDEAKDYYERLVLQYPHRKYPYRKVFPSPTDPQKFYLAMFGLWIFSVQERHSLLTAENERIHIAEGKIDANVPDGDSNASVSDLGSQQSRQAEVARKGTLQRARDIAVRLEELMNSPPYSDNSKFWELLGMIYLWVGDLSAVTTTQTDRPDIDDENSSPTTEDSSISRNADDDYEGQSGRVSGQVQQNKALQNAEKAFETAKLLQ